MRQSTGSGGLSFSFCACFSPGIHKAPLIPPACSGAQGPEEDRFLDRPSRDRHDFARPRRLQAKQGRQNQAAKPQPGKSDGPGIKKQPIEPSTVQDDFRDNIELVSGMLLFLIRAGIIFLELRLLWLAIQYAARYLLQLIMSDSEDPEPLSLEAARTSRGRFSPDRSFSTRSGEVP